MLVIIIYYIIILNLYLYIIFIIYFDTLNLINYFIFEKNKYMKFLILYNWLILKFLNLFLFFYKNIHFYTLYKQHSNFKWYFYIDKSLKLLNLNKKLLVLYILYLYITEKIKYLLQTFINIYIFQVNLFSIIFNFIYINNFFILIFYSNFFIFKNTIYNKNILKDKSSFNLSNFSRVYNIYLLNIYLFCKTVIIAIIVSIFALNYLCFYFKINLLKQLAIWFIVFNLYFWLISGFNFFIKRYRFGKFTSAIQRFWKRANMCFWLIEGFLFLLFYYYFLNSSQEPLYMYDYSSLNQEYLLSLTTAYRSLIILSLIIFILSYLIINLTSLIFTQLLVFISFISILIIYMFYLESYQFYYVITIFSECIWVYSEDFNVWKLSYESPKLRTKQYYFLMCLIAKYWHFIFIFLGWIFFIIKIFESKRVRYNLLSYNLQNLIILYCLNLLTYTQWLKWISKRFLETTYFWFYTNYDSKLLSIIFSEVILFLTSSINFNYKFINFFNNTLYSYKLFQFGDNYLYNNIFFLIN